MQISQYKEKKYLKLKRAIKDTLAFRDSVILLTD